MNGNAATWFVDRHMKEGRSAKIAFRETDGAKRTLSYGQLAAQSGSFAGALNHHGVRREERIAIIVLDQIEFPVVFWGSLKAGVIPVPMNTLLPASAYEFMLNDSRASLLVVSEQLWDVVRPALKGTRFLRGVIVIGDARDEATNYSQFVDGAPVLQTIEADNDEVAFWLYSSGSTGAPKGARHVHSSLKATADSFGTQVLGITEDDIVFSVAKMFFAYGLGNALTFPLSVGATSVLLADRPTPDLAFGILEHHQPTLFCGVPTFFAAMNAAAEKENKKIISRLRLCTSAGEALPRDVGKKWQSLTGAEIVDGVGSTEMLHIFLSNRPGDIVYGTSGVPVPTYEARLVDEHDKDVPQGEVGELLVCGASSADGYWNLREKSRSTFQGFWTRTGDKYEQTPDGRFVYCGRTDDMFKVSGQWVSPFEVEQSLVEHPAILEAAVVAHADKDGLEKPKAFVVFKDKANTVSVEELKDLVKERIGAVKYPRWVEIVDELPKTATGKIQRFKLRESE